MKNSAQEGLTHQPTTYFPTDDGHDEPLAAPFWFQWQDKHVSGMAFSLLCDMHDLRCRTELQCSMAASLVAQWQENAAAQVPATTTVTSDGDNALSEDTETCLLALVDLSTEVSLLKTRALRLKRCILLAKLLMGPATSMFPKKQQQLEEENGSQVCAFTFKALELETIELDTCEESIDHLVTLLLSFTDPDQREEEERPTIRNNTATELAGNEDESTGTRPSSGPLSPLPSRMQAMESSR